MDRGRERERNKGIEKGRDRDRRKKKKRKKESRLKEIFVTIRVMDAFPKLGRLKHRYTDITVSPLRLTKASFDRCHYLRNYPNLPKLR